MFGWFTEYVHPLHKVWKRNKKVEIQNTSLIWTPDNFKKKMNATCSKDLFSKKEIQVKQMTKLPVITPNYLASIMLLSLDELFNISDY